VEEKKQIENENLSKKFFDQPVNHDSKLLFEIDQEYTEKVEDLEF